MTNIAGKWALVTGASRGIGRQVALGLAGRGCHVALHSRSLDGTNALAAELKAMGVQTAQHEAELADPAQVEALIEGLKQGPAIDILYNNAAIMTPYRSEWTDTPGDDFRASFEVNVVALIRLCMALAPGMAERGWGRIVNVTSGIADQPELLAYASSKAAVDKFTQDAAGRLAQQGVLMNLMDPGWLRTDLGGPQAPGEVESVLPGALVPVLIEGGEHGQLFRAQDWAGKTL